MTNCCSCRQAVLSVVVHIRYLFAVVTVADVRGLLIVVLGVRQRCQLLFTSRICLQSLFTSGIVCSCLHQKLFVVAADVRDY